MSEITDNKALGMYGNFPIDTTTKAFAAGLTIAVITVVDGTATVSAKQNIDDVKGSGRYPDWSSVVLATGTYIVNLVGVTIVASGNTIAYYGG